MKINLIGYRCRHSQVKYFSVVFCLMAIATFPYNASGESFWKMSKDITILPEERVLLPKWCQIRMLAHPIMFNHVNAKPVSASIMRQNAMYAKVVGEDIYVYTHHYCRGLNWVNRYKRSLTAQYNNVEADRKYALNNALADFRFMEGHLRPTHKLYYPNLMNEAYVYSEQKNVKKAFNIYKEVMERKPTYAPAYVEYAKIMISAGQFNEAIKVLESGLKKTNGSPIIEQALSALDRTGTK